MPKNTIQFANWLTKWNNWDRIFTISIFVSIFVIAMVSLYSLKRRKLNLLSNLTASNKKRSTFKLDYKPRHNWRFNDLFTTPTYCNVIK